MRNSMLPHRSARFSSLAGRSRRPRSQNVLSRLTSRSIQRRVICCAIVLSLVILPAPGLAYGGRLFSTLTLEMTEGSVRVAAWLFNMIFGSQMLPEEGREDRAAQVRRIRISPSRFVGYAGESNVFQAIGSNFVGETIQGVV